MSEVAPGVPAEFERVISRCLRKDVVRRSQHMSDVKLALEELRDDSASGKLASPATAPALTGRRWLWPTIAGMAAIAALVLGWWSRLHQSAPPAMPPVASMVRVSPNDGYNSLNPAISADGKFVAYVSNRSGTDQLWLRQTAGGDPVQLTHTLPNKVTGAKFFPDGTRLLVHTMSPTTSGEGNTIEIVPLLGGPPRVLRTAPAWSPALSPDGRQIAWMERSSKPGPPSFDVMVMPTDGGTPRDLEKYRLTQGTGGWTLGLAWLPDGRSLGLTGFDLGKSPGKREWEWFALPVDGRDPIAMGAGAALRTAGLSAHFFMSANDRLLFAGRSGEDRRNVWQIGFDAGAMRVSGPPRQVTFGAEEEYPSDVNAAGTLAFASHRTSTDIYLLPLDHSTGQASGPLRRLTSDGRSKISFTAGGEAGMIYFQLYGGGPLVTGWALDPKTSEQRMIHPVVEFGAHVRISPDGRRIAYARGGGGTFSVSVGDVGAPPENAKLLCQKCGYHFQFSPDGQYLMIDPEEAPAVTGISLVEVATGRTTPWLRRDSGESLETRFFLGRDHVVVVARPGNTSDPNRFRRYVVPWRPTPVPRSEWVEQPVGSGQWRYFPLASHWAPFAYSFEGGNLVVRRFDARQKRFGDPQPVRFPPGSPVQFQSTDTWGIQGPGIAFAHRDTAGSAWLMKLPPE